MVASNFVAAGVAAAAELSVMQPLDVVKTRLQVQQAAGGMLSQLRHAYRADGLAGLWCGFSPGLAIVVPRRGLKFAAESQFSAWLGTGPWSPIASGAAAGACEALVITPLEVVKVQMQMQSSSVRTAAVHTAATTTARSIAASLWARGLATFYVGVAATVCKHSAHSAAYFASFRRLQPTARAALSSKVRGDLAAGFAAGLAAGTVNNPFDVLKTRQQALALRDARTKARTAPSSPPGLLAGLRHVVRTEGVTALFAGWRAKVLRLGPGSAIVFAVYHAVLERLQA